jgi:hypothetical protein
VLFSVSLKAHPISVIGSSKSQYFLLHYSFLSSHAHTLVSGIAPTAHRTSTTRLSALLPKEEMDTDQLEILKITERWNEVRLLSKEEAAKLEPEWKEAYERYYEKYDRDMSMMEEIATKLQSMIEPPNVKAKTKGQRRRDAWAKKQATAAARALKK